MFNLELHWVTAWIDFSTCFSSSFSRYFFTDTFFSKRNKNSGDGTVLKKVQAG